MKYVFATVAVTFWLLSFSGPALASPQTEDSLLRWDAMPALPDPLGVAGPYVGVHHDALIVAGGANFRPPVWENEKRWIDHAWVLIKSKRGQASYDLNGDAAEDGFKYQWLEGFKLDRPRAYGAVVSTEDGVACMGGNDAEKVFDDAFLLHWDPNAGELTQRFLPSLPIACANSAAARIGAKIYLVGGTSGRELESAMTNVWVIDLAGMPDYESMSDADLLSLAVRRGLIFVDVQNAPRDSKPDEMLISTKRTLIFQLYESDEMASHWTDLEKKELLMLASRYNATGLNEKADRSTIIQILMSRHWGDFQWKALPSWPGSERAFHVVAAQHNGFDNCIYVISGRRHNKSDGLPLDIEPLVDVYEFNPNRYDVTAFNADTGVYHGKGRFAQPWRRRADAPVSMMGGTAVAAGQSHILVLSGADGSLLAQAEALKDQHPGFPRQAWMYHTITDTWINAGPTPVNQVTSPATWWNDRLVLASGEVRPRIRSDAVWSIQLQSAHGQPFGWVDLSVLAAYLTGMAGIGVWFMRCNQNTNDYFRGGQKVPSWVAGLSIYATMLSSITYLAIPAKAYAQDMVYLLGNFMILGVAPIAVYIVLPFFYRIDATSAYEYLEKRFNRSVRLFGSAAVTIFHLFRMAIVMSLAGLALTTLTNLTPTQCVLLIGILSVVYCTLGGLEAVVWTDAVQTFILLGGAVLCLALMIAGSPGGVGDFFSVAWKAEKFRAVNFHWDMSSANLALWVVLLGAFGQNLASYTSDQAVVQRYMITPNIKLAARAVWTNGWMSIPGSILFYLMGAGLYVYYKSNPDKLDPTYTTDQILPMFISREIPIGLAGLIVAGVFAAAQSTISTSMNSTAAIVVTDFVRPFHVFSNEKSYLHVGKGLTVLLGVAGILLGLVFIDPSIRSLFDQFIAVIGLVMGVLGGLFCLGIFTRRANARGAMTGALFGTVCVTTVALLTPVQGYLYAMIGIVSCFTSGYLASLLFPSNSSSLDGLTIFRLSPPRA